MLEQIEVSKCTPVTAVQRHREKSDGDTKTAEPFGLRAAWLHFASQMEIQRLAKLSKKLMTKATARSEVHVSQLLQGMMISMAGNLIFILGITEHKWDQNTN